MKSLTELVKQWREDEDENGQEFAPWLNGLVCADQLEAYITNTQWVQITEDESTWPDENQRHMIWYTDDYVTHIEDWSNRHYKLYLSDWYRPLNDNDKPPASKED